MEFSRQEYWSEFPFSSPGDLPDPGTIPGSSALQADALLVRCDLKDIHKFLSMQSILAHLDVCSAIKTGKKSFKTSNQ